MLNLYYFMVENVARESFFPVLKTTFIIEVNIDV